MTLRSTTFIRACLAFAGVSALLGALGACGGGNTRIPDPEANCGTQLIQAPLPPRYEIPTTDLRQVVQIRSYHNRQLIAVGTGVVVGRTTVLTAAHNLLDDEDINRVAVAYRHPTGAVDEAAALHFELNESFRTAYAAGSDLWPGDIALIETDVDFEARGITPATIATDYIPPRDCADCPNASDLELYGYGPEGVDDLEGPLTGTNANPLNSDANIQTTGILTFQPFMRAGDSGGPVLRPRDGHLELVGIIAGEDFQANDRFEADNTGNRHVGVAINIPSDVLNELRDRANAWRNQNTTFAGPAYPAPAAILPNGTANAVATVYPTPGTSVPVRGSEATGVNGYYVIDFPFRNVIATPLPGPANGCR